MPLLPLDPDQLLTTTRAVRRRLDFTRDVPDELIGECVAAAMQAPSGSNVMTMQFVVVKDPAKRAAIGEIYGECYAGYRSLDGVYVRSIDQGSEEANRQQQRVGDSADFLGEHMGEAPVLVLPCAVGGRVDGAPAIGSASVMANILPATWSFMLAARARGLGTSWTTMHLWKEKEVADVVGIPFDSVQQVCLTPLAYTVGTDFKPASRPEPETIIHWDTW